MAKLQIVIYPSPVIRKRSLPVTSINGELQRFIDDMVETMYAAPGVGLAAPQVGALKRIIVLDPHEDRKPSRLMALINPEIVAAEGQIADEEGCLCIPNLKEEVSRFKRVVVKAHDRHEKEIVLEGSGLLSRILQHEIDHLNGVLFIDRVSPAKREVIKQRLKKAAKEQGSG